MSYWQNEAGQAERPTQLKEQTTVILVETRPHIATLIKEALEQAQFRVIIGATIDDVALLLARQQGLMLLLVNVGIQANQDFGRPDRFGPSGPLGALQRLATDQPLWKEIGNHPALQRVPMLCFSNDGASGPSGTLIVKSPQDFRLLAQAVQNYLHLLTSIPFLPQLLREEYLPSLKGALEDFPLSDLFQLFKLAGHSGILLLRDGGRVAVLGVAEGEIVHAFADHAQGQEAIYNIFEWKQARFAFYQDLALPTRTVTTSTEHLVLEASRRGDESSDLRNKIPSPRTLIYRAPSLTDQLPNMRLSMAELRILSVVGRRNTVGDIMKLAGMSELSTMKILDTLISRGMLTIGEEAVSKNTGILREAGQPTTPSQSSSFR
ncbi:MAG TPA: DUF4388 domain-containing protein [Ktedonobacterales bacterium]|jgi:hypothetical protein